MKAIRFPNNPIITPHMDTRMGDNINGPSLIRVPTWLPNRLGNYYLYFAHHEGTYIRMAYADQLQGPWRIYSPGVLDLADSFFSKHIASPDLHIREDRQEIWMYYHGCCLQGEYRQMTRLAISVDGIHFQAREELLGPSYWRAFEWEGIHYAIAMSGRLYRSRDGMKNVEEGPQIFPKTIKRLDQGDEMLFGLRHCAVWRENNCLRIWYTNRGDAPERILYTELQLDGNWLNWRLSPSTEILRPTMAYEGVEAPILKSRRGAVYKPVHQVRDPAIYVENGTSFLLYAVAGERGIAIAQLD